MNHFDLVVINAHVITMDADHPVTTAFAVSSGRIAAVGAGVETATAARVIDAGGLTILPGFNDAHCHTVWYGLSAAELDVSSHTTLTTVYAALEERIASSQPGDWVVANGFNHHQFNGAYPQLSVLDRIAPRNPIFIRHNSGHSCVVNSVALRSAGISSQEGSLPSDVVCDAEGRPSGLLQERAQEHVQALFYPHAQEKIVAAIDRGTSAYAAQGITSFTEAGIGGGWIGHSGIEAAAYQRARREGKLRARAQLMVALDTLHSVQSHTDDGFGIGLDLGLHTGFGDEWLSLGPAKVFLDGSLFAESAAMTESYCSHENKLGSLQMDEATLRGRITDAYRSGWSIAAHAIGDRAVDLALDIFDEVVRQFGPPVVPNRIEHGGVIRPDQLKRLAAQGIIVVPQASFFDKFGDHMAASLGPERTQWAYRGKSLLDAGLVLPGSSDRPVVEGSPLRGVKAFAERKTETGRILGPAERLSIGEALYAYTMGSAVATGSAATKGSISVGKLADFVALDRNPLASQTDQLDTIEILATAVGGTYTYGEL